MVPPEGVLLQRSGSRSGALVSGEGRGFNAHMQPDPSSNRAWALLIARWILGLIFFMAGLWKTFSLGPVEHARRLFVEPYAHTFLPRWSRWATGTVVPIIELVAGGLLLLGFRTRDALLAPGGVL